MSTDAELIQKQQEVREEILALKEQFITARIFNTLGKVFKQNSLGFWLSNIVLLNLILLSPWVVIGLALKEIERTIPVAKASIIAIELTILTIVLEHIVSQIMLNDIANRIIKQISIVDDLSNISHWFKKIQSTEIAFAFALPFCLLWTLLGVGGMSIIIHRFVGFGLMLTSVFVGLLAGIEFYGLIVISLILINLKEYQYEMNAFSPADSEIISDISDTSKKVLYISALYLAVITLIITSSLINEQLRVVMTIPLVVFGWAFILAQFLLTRSTLGAITSRAKWKTLNRIRDKINAIEATGDLSDKDTAERLLRLADIHKQIMASNTKTFDLKSVTTLFSQLMLPLLGLLLGNLDRLLDLFTK